MIRFNTPGSILPSSRVAEEQQTELSHFLSFRMPFNLTFVDKAGNAEASALTAAVLVAAAGVAGFCCTVEGVGGGAVGVVAGGAGGSWA